MQEYTVEGTLVRSIAITDKQSPFGVAANRDLMWVSQCHDVVRCHTV